MTFFAFFLVSISVLMISSLAACSSRPSRRPDVTTQPPPPPLQCNAGHFSNNTGATGRDYTYLDNTTTATACCNACSKNASCNAWTFHVNVKRCSIAPYAYPVQGKGRISGVRPIPPPPPIPPPHPPLGTQPNFILLLQDDQDIYMGGWTPMRQSQALLAGHGVTARNWFIHTPVCCPSRGELFSGRYFHNIRANDSKSGCMHIDTEQVNPISMYAQLERAGYTSAYFGKHLNDCPTQPPPGFTCDTCRWFAYNGDTVKGFGKGGGYYDSAFNDWYGGLPAPVDTTHPAPGIYLADREKGPHAGYTTSIIGNLSVAWMRQVVTGTSAAVTLNPNPATTGGGGGEGGGSTNDIRSSKQRPFMLTVGNRAPHQPFLPAPWYEQGSGPASRWIDDKIAPRTPDYNASCPDFHWLVAHQPPLTASQANDTDNVFRQRWRALMSVDDTVAALVQAVDELDIWNNTYFFITSHGWNLGQHRLPGGKHNVYDHSTRIPFVARGPGIKPGTYLDAPASNVDVAPTLLTLAGAPELAANMDGKSVASLLIQEETEAIDKAIENEGEKSVVSVEGAEEKVRGSDHGDNLLATKTDPAASATDALPEATQKALEAERLALAARGGWRTHHPIEFAALNNHTWFGHLIDDLVSNTYRALRFVGDPEYGDLLYAEFTSVDDWHYQKPVHYELFNMTEDPHQLVNLYSRSPQYLKDRLQARLVQQWGCQGASCL